MGPECPMASKDERPHSVRKVRFLKTRQLLYQVALTAFFSLDGEVKLFDIRGPDIAVATWDNHQGGLAAFDLHLQAGVFAS